MSIGLVPGFSNGLLVYLQVNKPRPQPGAAKEVAYHHVAGTASRARPCAPLPDP